jgi:hypothetical protein
MSSARTGCHFPARRGCGRVLPAACGALQQARRLAQHLFAGVAGAALEGVVDEDDARARRVDRLGLGDEHDVVEAGDAGLQQAQVLLRLVLLGDVLQHADQAHDLAVPLQRAARVRTQMRRPLAVMSGSSRSQGVPCGTRLRRRP